MHTMPALPVLHSTDLVNWTLLGYALDALDFGPSCRLEGGEIYGQGIWAPCIRYRNGTFYIFSNVNGRKTQIFRATNPRGPWVHTEAEYNYHDLGVFFDDDDRSYVVWGYRNLKIAELDESLHRIIPGTERDLTGPESLMGEGAHFYKVDGKYLITSAWFVGQMRMPCARANNIDGPWEINPAISVGEDFGLMEGYKIKGAGIPFTLDPPFDIVPPNPSANGRLNLHQGGIVDTPAGEWWGWSMMDYNSLGRLTALSPDNLARWVALFRASGKSWTHATHLGQTYDGKTGRNRCSVAKAQRHVRWAEPQSPLAMESCAGREQMVAQRTARPLTAACDGS